MTLGEKIKARRVELNISVEDFSKSMDISPLKVIKWEDGTLVPDVKTLAKIASKLEISMDELISDAYDAEEDKGKKRKIMDVLTKLSGVIVFVLAIICYILPFFSVPNVARIIGFDLIFTTNLTGFTVVFSVFCLWITFIVLLIEAVISVLGFIIKDSEIIDRMFSYSIVLSFVAFFTTLYGMILGSGTILTSVSFGLIILFIVNVIYCGFITFTNFDSIKGYVKRNEKSFFAGLIIFILLIILFAIM